MLNSLDDRTVHGEHRSALLKSGDVSLVVSVLCQVLPVAFIVSQRLEVDQAVCLIESFPSAVLDRLQLGCDVASEVSKPVWVERVSDA
jgi:hypothetical protein